MRNGFTLIQCALFMLMSVSVSAGLILSTTGGGPPPGVLAFNTATDLAGSDNVSSITVSYTLGTGSNLLIVVVEGSDSVNDVTGCDYPSGTHMTLDWSHAGVTGAYDSLYMFSLFNPAASGNIICSASTSHRIRAVAADYKGALSATPDATSPGSFSSVNTTGSYQDTVTTIANNSWSIAAFTGYRGNNPSTAGTGSTRRIYGVFYGEPAIYDSNGPITPAGNYTMSIVSPTSGAAGGMRIASFAP